MRRAFIKGNDAVVCGALLAGCRAFFGYPITPAMIFAMCFFLFAATLFYKSLTFTLMLAVLVIGSVLFALYYIYMNLLY